jgi:hypothetical protein
VRELKEVAHAKAATVAKLARARAAIETALEALLERRADILRACPLSLLNRNRSSSGAETRGGAMDEEKGEAAERGQGAVCELVPCAPPRCWPGSRQRTGWDRRG